MITILTPYSDYAINVKYQEWLGYDMAQGKPGDHHWGRLPTSL